MKIALALLSALLLSPFDILRAADPAQPDNRVTIGPVSDTWPHIFVHQDTCNVYVLREGDSAILFNLGDGTVLDHLPAIGVKNVEWILFTDHHREQCQGISRVDRALTKIAAPQAEQALLETPLQFRKWRPTLGDRKSTRLNSSH